MDEEHSDRTHRLIQFTDGAVADLAGIDNTTASMWGEAQAERYLAFLREVLATLAQEPSLGNVVDQRPDYLVYTAKYRKRRTAHGHRIFYKEIDGGIEVTRILHTAMYWPQHLPEESE